MLCNERNFDDLLSVLAVPVSGITWANAAARIAPTVHPSDYSFTYTGAVHIGRLGYTTASGTAQTIPYSIPIVPESGSVKDDESVDVGGRLHKVGVEFEVSADTEAQRSALRRLECGEWVLELCFFGDESGNIVRALVQATQDTCLVKVNRDGKKVSVSIDIENLMGAQIVAAAAAST